MANPFKVLVVDDEPDIVRYLELVLRRLGHEPVGAGDGEEAIQKALNDPPDLILLDVMMPIMDGFALCRALREREATRLVPVIIMTALQGVENRVKLLEHGADDVLAKPVDERELVARVQAALARKRDVDRRLGEITRVRDHFAKFVPDAVKRLVAANPEAPGLAKQELDVTVLFVDISGYSRLAERVAPVDLNALVERYFGRFLDRITDAGGDINETSGDGFMAIFQDGDPTAHGVRAVNAALMLLALTEALNQKEVDNPLAIHIGSTRDRPSSAPRASRAAAAPAGPSPRAAWSPRWPRASRAPRATARSWRVRRRCDASAAATASSGWGTSGSRTSPRPSRCTASSPRRRSRCFDDSPLRE